MCWYDCATADPSFGAFGPMSGGATQMRSQPHVPGPPWRSVAATLGSASVVVLAALTGGPAHADDPTTSPSLAPTSTTSTPVSQPSTGESSSTGRSPDSSPTLELSPSQGAPGDRFTATVTQFGWCDEGVRFRWDNGTLLGSASVDSGTASADLTVPTAATPGERMVVAACGDEAILRRRFVVSEPPPELTLSPDTGAVDSHVTATVTNVATCLGSGGGLRSVSMPIMLRWDDTVLIPSGGLSANDRNSAQFDFPVPRGPAGLHTVTAVCGSTQLPAPFTVAAQTLAVHPDRGAPGTRATATASGFGGCRPLSFQWDGQPLSTSVDGSDGLNVTFSIPENAADRDHQIIASCENLRATATFTAVGTAGPTPTTESGHGTGTAVTANEASPNELPTLRVDPPPSTTPWLLIAAIVATVLGTAEFIRRHRSHRRPPPPRVKAVPRADGYPDSSVRETPERGEATHALRVETHPGQSVLSVTEGR